MSALEAIATITCAIFAAAALMSIEGRLKARRRRHRRLLSERRAFDAERERRAEARTVYDQYAEPPSLDHPKHTPARDELHRDIRRFERGEQS